MRRREFIAGLGGAVARSPSRSRRRRSAELARCYSAATMILGLSPSWARFGRDLPHSAGSKAATCELIAYAGPSARAVQRTSVIPIVFAAAGDPTSIGLVRNIARPEGNMTGFAGLFGSLAGKWLELFKEAYLA
jgi:hypothetical protein